MAELIHLIYSSTPFGYDRADLNNILIKARLNNARDEISGALICRRDVYLQYLEGPPAPVQAVYARIVGDDRHVEVRLRSTAPQEARLFGEWAMLHDPARSIIWSVDEVRAGALDAAGPAAYLAMFADISGKMKTL